MSIEISVRPTTRAEDLYTYTQSTQIQGQTGCIGHLRADMDSNGEGFFSSWDNHRDYLKTEEFKAEFDEVINELRFGDDGAFLKNRPALAKYCRENPDAKMQTDGNNFGFRVDTDNYSYLMRVNPNKGEYNLYCYCYVRKWLDGHLKNAEKGIRFINSNYKEQFRILDGGTIRIRYPDGDVVTRQCRYIDDYHLEVGRGGDNLYHICEFAERMERCNAKVEPVDAAKELETKKNRGEAR